MKFILFLMLTTGAPPVTPEHWMLTAAEFDDEAACKAALQWFAKNSTRTRPNGVCLPKASKPAEAPVEPAKCCHPVASHAMSAQNASEGTRPQMRPR